MSVTRGTDAVVFHNLNIAVVTAEAGHLEAMQTSTSHAGVVLSASPGLLHYTEPSATAYLISQRDLVEGTVTQVFAPPIYQVTIRRLHELTGLDFTFLASANPLNKMNTERAQVRKRSDSRFPGRDPPFFNGAILGTSRDIG